MCRRRRPYESQYAEQQDPRDIGKPEEQRQSVSPSADDGPKIGNPNVAQHPHEKGLRGLGGSRFDRTEKQRIGQEAMQNECGQENQE